MALNLTLKISQRLFLIILTFSVPFLLLLYLMVSGINHNIQFAQSEQLGNRLLQPLNQALTLVLQDTQQSSTLGLASRLEQPLKTLAIEASELAEPLGIPASDFAESTLRSLPPEERVERLQYLIREVGNASKLILDPDLDSYYLMDVAVTALPEVQQRVGEALTLLDQPKLSQEDQAELRLYRSLFLVGLERIDEAIATAIREDPNFYQTNPSLAQQLLPLFQTYENNLQSLIEALNSQRLGGKRRTRAAELSHETLKSGQALWQVTRQELDQLLAQRIAAYEVQRTQYLAISITALAIASFLVWRIATEIVSRLDRIVKVTEQVAHGNLMVEVPAPKGNDEIAQLVQAIGEMVEGLQSLIGQAQTSGVQVSTSATELLATAKRQESTTHDQVAAAEQVRQSVSEISAMTEQLTQTIAEVAAVSGETMNLANQGQGSLTQMETAMAEMNQASSMVSEKLHQISNKTENIASVTSTIMKVADQTNLLSLNAAIEAEKAGEYGKGFSTVAREVRRLADQTAVASLDIERMVEEMNSSVRQGLMAMEGFIAKMQRNVSDVQGVGQQLNQIIQSVQVMSPRFEEVNHAMQEQSGSAMQMNHSVQALSDGMQFVTSTLSDTFLAIENLNVAALDLQEQVSQFRVQGGARAEL